MCFSLPGLKSESVLSPVHEFYLDSYHSVSSLFFFGINRVKPTHKIINRVIFRITIVFHAEIIHQFFKGFVS